jgi:hypothetical protein
MFRLGRSVRREVDKQGTGNVIFIFGSSPTMDSFEAPHFLFDLDLE